MHTMNKRNDFGIPLIWFPPSEATYLLSNYIGFKISVLCHYHGTYFIQLPKI